MPAFSYRTFSEIIPRRVRVLLEIGDVMRFLCCLLLGWSVLLSGCGESQEDAVAAIEKLGGTVTFNEKNPAKPDIVRFCGTDDAGLEHLKGLTSLQSLNLSCLKVTDAGLEHLNGLTRLTVLNLDGLKVTDAGLEHLKGLTSLNLLVLYGLKVTDTGLVHLKGL
jgi:hypothetical protein